MRRSNEQPAIRTHAARAVLIGAWVFAGCSGCREQASGQTDAMPMVDGTNIVPSASDSGGAPRASSSAPQASASFAVSPLPLPPAAPSEPPSDAEWQTASRVEIRHARELGCDARLAREWLKVDCTYNPVRGTFRALTRMRVLREEAAPGTLFTKFEKNALIRTVVALRPGVQVDVQYVWTGWGQRVLSVSWTQGAEGPSASFDRGRPIDDIDGAPPPESPGGKPGVGLMVEVPGGPTADGGSVAAFRIDRTEVTFWAYRECVQAGACTQPKGARGQMCDHELDDFHDKQPIHCVTHEQAAAYCAWADKRLPTMEEWTMAALGTDGRKLPWGDQRDPSRMCSEALTRTRGMRRWVGGCDVARYPFDRGPSGAMDMAGNLSEWTATKRGGNAVALGGHVQESGAAMSWERYWKEWEQVMPPGTQRHYVGFRCAR